MANAQFTRTPQSGLLDTYTLTLLFLPDIEDNAPLLKEHGVQAGAKLYMLVGKTDIDVMAARGMSGIDFSSDMGYGLEVHGEYADVEGRSSYLAGLRYQSPTDLTLITEYTETFERLPFLYLKATQKEPLDIVYSSVYLLYINETKSAAYRMLAGTTYDLKNGFTLDVAYVRTDQGDGGKVIIQYYF